MICEGVASRPYLPDLEGRAAVLRLARTVCATACTLVLAAMAPLALPLRAAAPPPECLSLVIFHGGITTCYLPGHLTVAERRLSPRPLRPLAIVARLGHLPLTQAIVLSGTGDGNPGPAVAILYIFGTPNAIPCPPTNVCASAPPYVIVQETVGQIALQGIRVDGAGGVSSPWSVTANLPHRKLNVRIESNARTQGLPVEIARSIVRAAT